MAPAVTQRSVAPAAVAKPVATPAPVAQGQTSVPPVTPPVTPPAVTPPAPPTNKEIKPPYSGSVPPPTQPPTGYGNQQNKDNELQYLENELKRLQDLYGADCGGVNGYGSQCDILKQMIQKNKGGSVIKG
jgi:hypothetical protein